jgi:hypothetical protein
MGGNVAIRQRWISSAAMCGAVFLALIVMWTVFAGSGESHELPAGEPAARKEQVMEQMRRSGDLKAQRHHVWNVIAQLVDRQTPQAQPRAR